MIRARFIIVGFIGTCTFVQSLAGQSAADAVTARQERAQREFTDAVRTGLAGHVTQRVPGDFIFVPDRGDLPAVSIAGDSIDVSKAEKLPLVVRGSLNARGLTVDSFALRKPQLPTRLSAVLGPASDRLLNAIEQAVKPPAASRLSAGSPPTAWSLPTGLPRTVAGAGSALDRQLHETLDQLLSEYAKALQQNRQADAEAIARRWSELRRYVVVVMPVEEKAIYHELDNYPPWQYAIIFRQSAAVVAIAAPGATTSFCSGVLITADLVLTAAHCFSPSRLPQDQEVWFHYVDGPPGPPILKRRRSITGFVVIHAPERLERLLTHQFGPDVLDYALIRLAGGPDPTPPDVVPQCVRRSPPHKGDAVYVIGYPLGQAARVHDSARVYLPHRVFDGEDFRKLRLNVHADSLGFPDHEELMQEFDASYATTFQAEGLSWRALFNIRAQGQPQMGIVADTFRGNSGGPVFERDRRQCVVGLLVQGVPDTGERREPNWKEHEQVLPMSAILEDLARSPEGRELLGVIAVQ